MQCQQALIYMMKLRHITISELAARTKHQQRWLESVVHNPDWRPKLDTIWSLCNGLGVSAISFLEYAEVGSCGVEPRTQNPEPRTQNPEPRTQNPEPRTQNPEPRTQNPEPRTQNPELKPKHITRALREIRTEKGFSQHTMEEITPFSLYAVNLREGKRCTSYPTITTLSIYCKAYGITVSTLVGRIYYLACKEEGIA